MSSPWVDRNGGLVSSIVKCLFEIVAVLFGHNGDPKRYALQSVSSVLLSQGLLIVLDFQTQTPVRLSEYT